MGRKCEFKGTMEMPPTARFREACSVIFGVNQSLSSMMADASPKPFAAANELTMLREEIAKWQQRVPKITELLRSRSDALAESEEQNRYLRKALAEEQEKVALSRGEPRIPAAADGRTELEEELVALRFESIRLQKAIGSLETRNRMLSETVEVLTHQFSRANAELLAFRRACDSVSGVNPALAEVQTVAANEATGSVAGTSPSLCAPTLLDLMQIRGLGIKSRQRLVEAGIDSVESLAAIPNEKLDDPAFPLFSLGPRMRRERWVEQARQLLDSPTSGESPSKL